MCVYVCVCICMSMCTCISLCHLFFILISKSITNNKLCKKPQVISCSRSKVISVQDSKIVLKGELHAPNEHSIFHNSFS